MPETDIDGTINADQTTTSPEPSSDTAAADTSSEATSNAAPSADASSSADSAVADTPAGDGQQSFTSDSETKAVSAQPNPYEKRFRDVQSWSTKLSQENAQLKQQVQELREQFQSQQQKQAAPQQRPWDETHPDHQNFLRLVDRAEYFSELIEGEDNPEIIKLLQQKQLRSLGEPGVQLLREWRDDVRRQERERRLNPKAFYSKIIRQEAQPVVQETLQSTSQNYQQMIQARDQAQKWVQGNPEVATPENIKAVLGLMERGKTFDQASAQVERDHYRSLVSNAKKESASAGEKERLLQGNAAGAIHRNPNASRKVDIKKLIADRGLDKVDSRARIDAYFEADKEGLL